MFTVYVLRSLKDGKRYVGSTSDLSRRLSEHNRGTTKSTRWRAPFEVIYTEAYRNREEAEQRERFLKTGKGREDLNRILAEKRA